MTREPCWLDKRVDLLHGQIQRSLQFLIAYLKFSNPLAGLACLMKASWLGKQVDFWSCKSLIPGSGTGVIWVYNEQLISGLTTHIIEINTAWKVSVFGVFMVRIFRHSDWMWTRKTPNTDTFHAVKKAQLSRCF